MKEKWTKRKLGEVCDFEGGSQPPKSEFIFTQQTGYLRFLQIRDFGSEKNITYIRDSKKNRLCDENDILIGRYGASVGKVLTGKAGAYNVALMKTIPNLNVLDKSWFYYFLVSDEFQIPLLDVADRSAQAGFSKDDIYNFPIPVPPLVDQHRIVTLLDEAFADIATAKANAEKNLQNARAMLDSELEGLCADQGQLWQEMPLSQIGQTQTGSTPKTSEPANYGDHLPFIKPGDFNIDGSLDYENEGLSALGAQSARKVAAHSVLMVCIGATIGKCGYTDQVVTTNQQINALTPNAGHNPKFIYYQMLSSCFQSKVMHGSGQATLPIINKSKWSALTLRMPAPDEQTRIVKRLDDLSSQCRRLESIYRQKLTALDDLKKSLLHQAFSGLL